ncbi:MAG: AsmA family protein [Spirochaetota bacterium]|nr:AsmA family protein [Spirochaetota bacterium]
MKKLILWFGISIGIVLLLIVIAGVVVMFVVDKEMIASQMESSLNRHVTIGDIDVGIFSALSGIEVKDVKISNYKTRKQLEALKDKPVKKRDLFVGLKAFSFKIRFLPLLSGNFVLNEFVLDEPIINIIKNRDGSFNFDDLTKPKSGEPEKEEKRTEGKAKTKTDEKGKKASDKPFTADDLPIEITIGKIGIEKGELKYLDRTLGQTFQVYNLTALIHSIDIDPKDLDNGNSVKLKVEMGVKTIGKMKSGSVKSFDIGFDINGNIIPFDIKSRKADPEIDLLMGLPYGTITGLQIFEKMKSVEALSKYCGKLDFLKKDIKWSNAFVKVWYKGGIVKFSESKINTDDYLLTFVGSTNVNSKAIAIDADMLLADKHQDSIRSGITKNVSKSIKGKMKKYVKPDQITSIAMKRIANEDGKVYLKYSIKGTLSKPDAKLVHPRLPSIKGLIKDSAGDVKDIAKEKVKEIGKKVAEKAVDKGKDKAKEEIEKKLDKKFKKQFKF